MLQELKSYAIRLDRSPIMNALFSPSTVPILPPTLPVWPSKYTAPKYLPPNQRLDGGQSFRRGVIQVQTDGLSPELLEQLEQANASPQGAVNSIVRESLAQNTGALNNIMKESLNFNPMSQMFDRFFNRELQSRTNAVTQKLNENFNNMNNFFNSPNFIPIRNPSSIFHGFPQFQMSVPYISPNLRNLGIQSPSDDIDVRIDKRPDADVNIQSANERFQNGSSSVIQIGSGLKNVDGGSQMQLGKEQSDEPDEIEDENEAPAEAAEKDEDKENDGESLGDKLIAMNQVKEKSTTESVGIISTTVEDVETTETTTAVPEKAKSTTEEPETTTFGEPETTSSDVTKRKIDDSELNQLRTEIREAVLESETTTELSTETTSTDPPSLDTTIDPLLEETTTDSESELETTTFNLEERLDVNVIKTLSG